MFQTLALIIKTFLMLMFILYSLSSAIQQMHILLEKVYMAFNKYRCKSRFCTGILV